MKNYDVFGIGNALVDIQAQVSDALIQEIGSPKGIMNLVDSDFQANLLTKIEEIDLHTVGGGSAANTMVGLANLGGPAMYAGKVGDDLFGSFYAQDMAKAGVHYKIPYGNEATGTCVVLITPDAQRTFFTHLGISTKLKPEDIDEESIKQSQWVYIEGYLWDADGPKAASRKAMEVAKKNGVQVAYSFSDPFCVKRARKDFLHFTQEYVDLVFCNEEEAFAFAETDNHAESIRYITDLNAGVVLTAGTDGSHFCYKGNEGKAPCFTVKAVDSTGAGDLYAAGVLYGLTHGHDIQKACRLGAFCASKVVATMGARLKEKIDVSDQRFQK